MSTAAAQRWFIVGLVAIFAAVSVNYAVKVLTPRRGETSRSAIVRWRDQLQQLDAGEDIYARFVYPNPPVMAIMLRPLAELPALAGAMVWYAIKVGFALAAFAFAFRLAEDEGMSFPPWAKALAVVLSLRPVLGDLMHGNVNLLILFLVVSGLYLFRRGRDVSAGVVLALAVACKVTPALFIPYFVWKRAWKTVAGMALGLGLFFFILPAAVLGWQENLTLLQSWFERMVLPFVAGGVVTSEHPNQSLPGLLQRLFTASPSFAEFQGDRYVPTAYHTIVDLGAGAKWLVKGIMAVFCIAVVRWCRTPTEPRSQSRLGAEFALVTLGMLLFSERTWKHHAVTMVLPFAVLCYRLAVERQHRWCYVGVLATATCLMSATSTGLLPDEWAKQAQAYGAYTLAFAVLTVGLFGMLIERRAVPISTTDVLRRAA